MDFLFSISYPVLRILPLRGKVVEFYFLVKCHRSSIHRCKIRQGIVSKKRKYCDSLALVDSLVIHFSGYNTVKTLEISHQIISYL